MTKAVADIVQANRMRQLSKHKTHHMAPSCEVPRSFVHSMLAGKFFSQVRRDEFTKLMQRAAIMFGWC